MRKFVFLGVAGLFLALAASGANAQSLLTRPSASPYALLNQGSAAPALTEGRSAFTNGTVNNASPSRGPLKNSGPAAPMTDTFDAR
jgi:hypothetical protein